MKVFGALNEYQARLFAAEKAIELGRGGITHLARLTGMSRVTITQGVRDLSGSEKVRSASSGRVRNPGGSVMDDVISIESVLHGRQRL